MRRTLIKLSASTTNDFWRSHSPASVPFAARDTNEAVVASPRAMGREHIELQVPHSTIRGNNANSE